MAYYKVPLYHIYLKKSPGDLSMVYQNNSKEYEMLLEDKTRTTVLPDGNQSTKVMYKEAVTGKTIMIEDDNCPTESDSYRGLLIYDIEDYEVSSESAREYLSDICNREVSKEYMEIILNGLKEAKKSLKSDGKEKVERTKKPESMTSLKLRVFFNRFM